MLQFKNVEKMLVILLHSFAALQKTSKFYSILLHIFGLAWATTDGLPSLNFLFWKVNFMSNQDSAHDEDRHFPR